LDSSPGKPAEVEVDPECFPPSDPERCRAPHSQKSARRRIARSQVVNPTRNSIGEGRRIAAKACPDRAPHTAKACPDRAPHTAKACPDGASHTSPRATPRETGSNTTARSEG